MKVFQLIPMVLVLILFGTEFGFAKEAKPLKLMQFVCRAYVPGTLGAQIDPHFAITVQQTAAVQVKGKTYDGRYFVPGNDEFEDIYDLLGVGIPLRIKIYKSASSINRLGKKGKEFFNALESSGLPHERYDAQNPNNVLDPVEFGPLWSEDDKERTCGLSYFYEERDKKRMVMLCSNKKSRIPDRSSHKGLICDPPYLVDAPRPDQQPTRPVQATQNRAKVTQ